MRLQTLTSIKTFEQFTSTPRFHIENNKFQLFSHNILVGESGFNIETPDEWFDVTYVTLHDLKIFEEFQGQGWATYLLEHIFAYVKNRLQVNIITLILEKTNVPATKLYFKLGFEIFMEYDSSYCLLKKLP